VELGTKPKPSSHQPHGEPQRVADLNSSSLPEKQRKAAKTSSANAGERRSDSKGRKEAALRRKESDGSVCGDRKNALHQRGPNQTNFRSECAAHSCGQAANMSEKFTLKLTLRQAIENICDTDNCLIARRIGTELLLDTIPPALRNLPALKQAAIALASLNSPKQILRTEIPH
jgi:hypothetical protein